MNSPPDGESLRPHPLAAKYTKVKPPYPVLVALFFCASAPLAAFAMTLLRDASLAKAGASVFEWPVWSAGTPPRRQVYDPVEISSMVMFGGAVWMFGRIIRHHPASRLFWPLWTILFLSGLALVNMGRLHTGFAAVAGLALLAKIYEKRRDGLRPPDEGGAGA